MKKKILCEFEIRCRGLPNELIETVLRDRMFFEGMEYSYDSDRHILTLNESITDVSQMYVTVDKINHTILRLSLLYGDLKLLHVAFE